MKNINFHKKEKKIRFLYVIQMLMLFTVATVFIVTGIFDGIAKNYILAVTRETVAMWGGNSCGRSLLFSLPFYPEHFIT